MSPEDAGRTSVHLVYPVSTVQGALVGCQGSDMTISIEQWERVDLSPSSESPTEPLHNRVLASLGSLPSDKEERCVRHSFTRCYRIVSAAVM